MVDFGMPTIAAPRLFHFLLHGLFVPVPRLEVGHTDVDNLATRRIVVVHALTKQTQDGFESLTILKRLHVDVRLNVTAIRFVADLLIFLDEAQVFENGQQTLFREALLGSDAILEFERIVRRDDPAP